MKIIGVECADSYVRSKPTWIFNISTHYGDRHPDKSVGHRRFRCRWGKGSHSWPLAANATEGSLLGARGKARAKNHLCPGVRLLKF
jgi:hypothetical protein